MAGSGNVMFQFFDFVQHVRQWQKYSDLVGEKPTVKMSLQDRLEYSEESWRPEVTCSHSDCRERPTAVADVKNSQGVNNNHNNSGIIHSFK